MSFDATLGSTLATSYIAVDVADAIWANTLSNAAWTALTTEEKQQALMASTSALEQLSYTGTRCSPSTDDANKPQRLQWPRSNGTCKGIACDCASLPLPVQQSCAYLALSLFNDPNSIIPGVPSPAPERGPVKMQQLGDLKQEFFSTDNGTKAGVSAPIVIQRYSWLIDVLACWLSTNYGSSAIIERVRS